MSSQRELHGALLDAYRGLGSLTPLEGADCGALCGTRCCQGDDTRGMLLFPGEYALLAGCGAFRLSPEEPELLLCDGTCPRQRRPLACRIFPFTPILREGRVEIHADCRARPLCPLLKEDARPYLSNKFLHALQAVFEKLDKLEEFHRHLLRLTAIQDDYARFLGPFTDERGFLHEK